MTNDEQPRLSESEKSPHAAAAAARKFFGAGADPQSTPSSQSSVRQFLVAAVISLIAIPALFLLKYRDIGPIGWGLTIFLVVLCLLVALGLHFQERTELHTPVEAKNDWADRTSAFWLVACAFGPLAGWLCTAFITLTPGNWQWLYGARVFFAVVLPVLTALPLLRYVRGNGAPLMLAMLIGITALPVWSALWTLRDLWSGPAGVQLIHTGKTLAR